MAVAGSAVAHLDAQGSSGPPRRKLLMMALSLAVVAVSVGVWQWKSPDAFAEQGSEAGIHNPVGTAVLVGVATPRQEMDPAVLTVHSVEPQITEGDAQVDVIVCHTGPGRDGIGAVRGPVDSYCESHRAPDGARLGQHDDVILRVHSDKPGHVVIEGVKVTYSHGWRRGSQVTGLTVKVDFGTETVRD
jgi:hypothetical protein